MSCFAFDLCAAEVDSFTDRDARLKDSKVNLNRLVNTYFTDAARRANVSKSCDMKTIRREILGKHNRWTWSRLENELYQNVFFDQRLTSIDNSIYGDWEIFALRLAGLAPLMRIGDIYIGTDKLSHFFHVGLDLFERVHVRGWKLQDVLDWNRDSEESYFGLWITGIFSYADLAANYDGITFWERVANTNLPLGVKPYFECHEGKWSRIGRFDIDDYVNPAWDEANNCNLFRNTEMTTKVIERISAIEKVRGEPLQCPISKTLCSAMIKRYAQVASQVISPVCFAPERTASAGVASRLQSVIRNK